MAASVTSTSPKPEFASYAEFWEFYRTQHSTLACRALHFVGLTLGFLCLGLAAALGNGWLVLAGFVQAYAFSWIGHFAFEGNKPATFGHPFWSFISDFRMYGWILRGKKV